jgi:hypothetical protein
MPRSTSLTGWQRAAAWVDGIPYCKLGLHALSCAEAQLRVEKAALQRRRALGAAVRHVRALVQAQLERVTAGAAAGGVKAEAGWGTNLGNTRYVIVIPWQRKVGWVNVEADVVRGGQPANLRLGEGRVGNIEGDLCAARGVPAR